MFGEAVLFIENFCSSNLLLGSLLLYTGPTEESDHEIANTFKQ